jgi:hypothetical protein
MALLLTIGSVLPLHAQAEELWVCWYQGVWVVDGVVQDGWACMEVNSGGFMLIAIRR